MKTFCSFFLASQLRQSFNDLETPTTPLESELSYPNTTADDIEARLILVKGNYKHGIFIYSP